MVTRKDNLIPMLNGSPMPPTDFAEDALLTCPSREPTTTIERIVPGPKGGVTIYLEPSWEPHLDQYLCAVCGHAVGYANNVLEFCGCEFVAGSENADPYNTQRLVQKWKCTNKKCKHYKPTAIKGPVGMHPKWAIDKQMCPECTENVFPKEEKDKQGKTTLVVKCGCGYKITAPIPQSKK